MTGFRNILTKLYMAKNMYTPHTAVKEIMSSPKNKDAHHSKNKESIPNLVDIFRDQVLPKFPPIFHEWFLETFPEPSRWLSSRKIYATSVATMSMVGYIVGLGDRHGENILFDENTGGCLHVDLNWYCSAESSLFEKGLEFEVPEKVPFRLTHNMVDAFGVTGVEGRFRKSCEVSLNILRTNRGMLTAVLETFLHDPLCEWSKSKHAMKSTVSDQENQKAIKILDNIDRKLQGYSISIGLPLSAQGQVSTLIEQATDLKNLSGMYIGWGPYL